MTDVQIIHARDLIHVITSDVFNVKENVQVLSEIAALGAALTDCRILLDTRKSNSVITATDLWLLIKGFASLHPALEQKMVVLCLPGQFDYAAFFALYAQNRGLHVAVFTSFEEAIEWLIAK